MSAQTAIVIWRYCKLMNSVMNKRGVDYLGIKYGVCFEDIKQRELAFPEAVFVEAMSGESSGQIDQY